MNPCEIGVKRVYALAFLSPCDVDAALASLTQGGEVLEFFKDSCGSFVFFTSDFGPKYFTERLGDILTSPTKYFFSELFDHEGIAICDYAWNYGGRLDSPGWAWVKERLRRR